MKILTLLDKIDNLSYYNIDGIVIPIKNVSYKTFFSFNLNDLIYIFNNTDKEIFILANRLAKNNDIDYFKDVFNFIKVYKKYIKGIIIGDIGVLNLSFDYGLSDLIIYNPDTLITSYKDFNFLSNFNISGCFLSPEITLDELKYINDNKKNLKTFYIGFGHISMFYSPRKLLRNYYRFINKDQNNGIHYIKEETREDLYPIYEDQYGTFVFRSNMLAVINHKNIFDNFDYLLVNNFLMNYNDVNLIINAYKNGYDINYLNEKTNYNFDEGFLSKKTIYKI